MKKIVRDFAKAVKYSAGGLSFMVKLKNIELVDGNEREVRLELSDGNIVHIVSCYDSWQQYGACTDTLWLTVPIAERVKKWLNGGFCDFTIAQLYKLFGQES